MQKFNYKFNKEDYLEYLNSDQVKNLKKSFFRFYVKSRKKVRTFLKNDLNEQRENMKALYFVHKALNQGASKKLPYRTLELLGYKLSQPEFKEDIAKIIKDNVIKCNENYYKLDDVENQKKIQKALRNFQFDKLSEVQDHAA